MPDREPTSAWPPFPEWTYQISRVMAANGCNDVTVWRSVVDLIWSWLPPTSPAAVPEHYREAEALLQLVAKGGNAVQVSAEIAAAQVHATLALAVAVGRLGAENGRQP